MSESRGYRAARVVTCGGAHGAGKLAVIEQGAVVVGADGRIAFVGAERDAPAGVTWRSAADGVITPGLVDAHTHACWAGSRHHEYAIRMAGGDYQAIAHAGGGILSTHRAVAAASEDELARALAARLLRMAALGVTCVEVKSGYGLDPAHERKQLRAIARVAARTDVPHVVATFLALHALPPHASHDRASYVQNAAALVGEIAKEKLASFVDAYVDEKAFTIDEARAVGVAARAAGLGVRLHVGQFADVGGAALCAELGASSADHLEHITDAGIAALAGAKTHAVLLPTASFTLGQAPPPVKRLRDGGVPLVVASDANPGTAPTESLPLAMALAVRLYGLSPAESLLGATTHAAASLAIADRGVLRVGARADLVAWDLPHEEAIVQPWGTAKTRLVVRDGVEIAGQTT